MKVVNKVIVMVRLEDGGDVKASVKQNDGKLTDKHYRELVRRLHDDIEPEKEGVLYYTIRADLNGKKDNWKVKSYREVIGIVNKIFNKEE